MIIDNVIHHIGIWRWFISEDEIIEDVRVHIREKYSPDGYAAKTMYFKDPSFEKMLVEVERITRTPEGYARVQREFNKKRFSK